MWVFKWWPKETMLFDHLTCSESEFQKVGTATEKARVPAWDLTLGKETHRCVLNYNILIG